MRHMETIYNWLLHNMGNEGRFLLILNVHRQPAETGSAGLAVMARTKDIELVSLLIEPGTEADSTDDTLTGQTLRDDFFVAGEEDVLAYLADGKRPDQAADGAKSGIRVRVFSAPEP